MEIREGAREDEVIDGDLTKGSTRRGGGRRKNFDGVGPRGVDGDDLGMTATRHIQ